MKLISVDYPANSEKYDLIRQMLLDEETFLYMDASPLKAPEDFADWLSAKNTEIDSIPALKALWFIEEEGALVGYFHIKSYEKKHQRLELNVAINKGFRGRGLVTEGFSKIIDYIFTGSDIRLIMAGCRVKNIGSLKAMEKAGLRMTAHMREWVLDKIDGTPIDCRWYSITRKEWKEEKEKALC